MDKFKEQKLISHDSYIGRRYSEGCLAEQCKTDLGQFGKFEGYEREDFRSPYLLVDYPGYYSDSDSE
jgi:hypothetical protein